MKTCIKCHQDMPLSKFYWREDHGRYRGACVDCSRTGKGRRRRIVRNKERVPGKKPCDECMDLEHRRPEDRACICGEKFAPLHIPGIEEILAMPREDRRTLL